MPMARAFPAFCLLFRHPSRATILRDDRIDEPERSMINPAMYCPGIRPLRALSQPTSLPSA
jgi:hypothetical protein